MNLLRVIWLFSIILKIVDVMKSDAVYLMWNVERCRVVWQTVANKIRQFVFSIASADSARVGGNESSFRSYRFTAITT